MLLDDDIVVLADARWDDPKRVRHKMPQAWAKAGNRVLWVEEPIAMRPTARTDKLNALVRAPLRRVAPRLWVGTPPAVMSRGGSGLVDRVRWATVASAVLRWLVELRMKPNLLVIWQEAALYPLLSLLPHRTSVYYASDRYRFNQTDTLRGEILAACCQAVDLAWATSEKICASLRPHQPASHVIPHAVDVDWYRAHSARSALEGVPSPRVVFTGVATAKFDFGLLDRVARLMPEVQFVVAGPVLTEDSLSVLSNVHWLGEQPIDDLPSIMAAADVLMLPYVRDLVRTFSGLPLKLYEYLVAEKPIVSTPFTDLELPELGLVDIEGDAEGWARVIRKHLEQPLTPGERWARARLAEQNTYAHRIEQQRAILGEHWPGRSRLGPWRR